MFISLINGLIATASEELARKEYHGDNDCAIKLGAS